MERDIFNLNNSRLSQKVYSEKDLIQELTFKSCCILFFVVLLIVFSLGATVKGILETMKMGGFFSTMGICIAGIFLFMIIAFLLIARLQLFFRQSIKNGAYYIHTDTIREVKKVDDGNDEPDFHYELYFNKEPGRHKISSVKFKDNNFTVNDDVYIIYSNNHKIIAVLNEKCYKLDVALMAHIEKD